MELMSSRPSYFTIGVFVSAGLILLLGALMILGAGVLWRETVTIETYMDESVQGIAAGSQVKMRGVHIGNVDNISFVFFQYPQAREAKKRYVLITISIDVKTFGDIPVDDFKDTLQREVQRGLRIRLLPMGITGTAYLEMDYTDPQRHPPLRINWEPENPYVPSAPGTFARLEETFESLHRTMANIEELDLQNTLNHMDHLLQSLDHTVQSLNMQHLSLQAEKFLEELRESNRMVSNLLGPEQVDIDDNNEKANLHAVLIDTRNILKKVETGIDRLEIDQEDGSADKLAQTIARLHESSMIIPGVLEDISETAQSLKKGSQGVDSLTRNTYAMMRATNEELRLILDNMRLISENLLDLSQDAREYPSYLLFGDEPLEREPK